MLRNSASASSSLFYGTQNYLLRYYSRTLTRSEQRSLYRKPVRGLTSRFSKPMLHKLPLEDVVIAQRVPLEQYTDIEFEGVQTKLSRQFISTTLDQFARQTHIRALAAQHSINGRLFDKAYHSFRLFCCSENSNPQSMEPALRVTLSDIKKQEQSVDSLYPFFVKHARSVFPHLESLKELQTISDLTQPHNWYPLAREIHRKIIFHAGPTNSGKTYEALECFKRADSGTYCGPLRLLAYEVYKKVNEAGTPCDMITGENRLFAFDSENPAPHKAITVEMLSPEHRTHICVIDEIQMLRDAQRGAGWTRALLGAAADEVHLCGEESAYEIICRLLDPIGEHVDLRRYERKCELNVISTHGLRDLSSVQDGDCIVHFNKRNILQMARKLKTEQNRECAIVFGDLPPETKREQVKRFNDPDDPCKVLLATDAIGMGMNLNIKRVIFTSLKTREDTVLPSYFVKQIAGRAGRYASAYCTGEVMTMHDKDALLLKKLMDEPIEPIDQVGIAPSYDQIEMFSFHLPQYSLTQLLDIFVSICTVSDNFFVCMDASIRDVALLIEHIPLSLRERFVFCMCPVSSSTTLLNSVYVKMVRRYAEGNAITFGWIRSLIAPELKVVDQIEALHRLVDVYDFLGGYLWLSYRFEEHFPHREEVRELQKECGNFIYESLQKMVLSQSYETEKAPEVKKDNLEETDDDFDVGQLNEMDKSKRLRSMHRRIAKEGLQEQFDSLIAKMRKQRKPLS